jgi:hypothetical protein
LFSVSVPFSPEDPELGLGLRPYRKPCYAIRVPQDGDRELHSQVIGLQEDSEMSGLACRIKCPKFRIGKRPTSELSYGSLFRLRHLFGFDAGAFSFERAGLFVSRIFESRIDRIEQFFLVDSKSDQTAGKLIDIFLRNIRKKWEMPPITWKLAASQFAIEFAESLSEAVAD